MSTALTEQILLQLKATVTGQGSVRDLTGDVNALDAATRRLDGTYRDVNGRLRDSHGRFVAAGRAAREAGNDAGSSAGGFGRLNTGLLNLSSGINVVQFAMQGLQALVRGGVGLLKLAGEAEQTQVAFTTLLKDGERARAFLQELAQFASNTPFEFEGLKTSARQMLAFGFEAKAIIPMMRAIGDTVGSLGGGAEGIERVTRALGQMQAKGKVSAEEMMQLAEQGIPAWEMLAKSIGVSIPEAMKMAEKGTITASQGIAALLSGMQEKFGGGMKAQSQTLLGMWSNTMDSLRITATNFGTFLAEKLGAKTILSNLNDGLAKVQGMLSGGQLEANFSRIGQVLERLNPITEGVKTRAVAAWTAMQDVARNVLMPIFERLQPIAERVWSEVPKLIESAARAIEGAFTFIKALWDNVLRPVWDAIAPTVQAAVTLVMRLLSGMLDSIGSIFKSVGQLVNGDWKGAMTTMSEWADRVGEAVGTAMLKVWDAIKDMASKALDRAKNVGLNIKDGIIVGMSGLAEDLALALGKAVDEATAGLPQFIKDRFGITAYQSRVQDVAGQITSMGSAAQQRLDLRNMPMPNVSNEAKAFFAAIFGQESSGNYSALNPLSYALGKYQTMPQNILGYGWDVPQNQRAAWAKARMGDIGIAGKGWDYEALKRDITPQEYLNNPAVQEAISQYKMAANLIAQLRKNGGDMLKAVTEAAKDWYGRGKPQEGYPTPDEYAASVLTRFQKLLGTVSDPKSMPGTSGSGSQPTDSGPMDFSKLLGGGASTLTTKDLKDYSLTLADWNKNQARALELAREAAKAESDLTGQRGLQVAAAMREWAGEDKARQHSYQLAVQLYSRQQAASKQAEQDQKKAEDEAKKLATARLAAERALADGRLDLARRQAQAVITGYQNELRAAGDNASARLAVEQRLGGEVLKARNVLSRADAQGEKARLERERNAAINAEGVTLSQRRQLWTQYAQRIAQVDHDLQATLQENAAETGRILDSAQDSVWKEDDAERARVYTEKVQGYLDNIQSMTQGGLIEVYNEAVAHRDQTLLRAIYDEWERRRLSAEQKAQEEWEVINQIQVEANNAVAQAAQATAAELAGLGDSDGALAVLTEALDEAMDAAMRGENAADAIRALTQAINDLTESTALTDTFNTFVAGLSGTISEQIGQVVDYLDTLTDPKLIAKAKAFLAELRQQLPRYDDPSQGGYTPGANGFVQQPSTGLNLSTTGTAMDLWKAMGAGGTKGFAAELDRLTPEDFSRLGTVALQGFIKGLGDDQQWAAVADKLKQGLELANQKALDAGHAEEFTAIIEQFVGLDSSSADYASTLEGSLIPQLQALALVVKDPQLAADIQTALSAMNGETDAARSLGAALTDAKLKTLEFQRAMKQISEADYLDQRDALLVQQENDTWAKLEGTLTKGTAAYQAAWQQHQNRLTEIERQGIQDRDALAKTVPEPVYFEGTATAFEERIGAAGAAYLKLKEQLQSGALTTDEANAALLEMLPSLDKMADLAEKAGDLETAEAIRAWAAELRGLGGEALKTAEALSKLNRYADYVAQLAGAFGQLGDAMGDPNLTGAANLAGKLANMAGDIGRLVASGGADIGAWAALTTKVLSSIADAISGFQKAKRAAEDARKSFQDSFRLIDASTFSTFGTRSRGFFADLFGGGPEVIQEVNQVAASIARTLEGGVSGAFQNGIRRFLSGEGNMLENLRSGIKDAVMNAVVDAIIQGAIIKGALGGMLTNLTNTLAAGGDPSGLISQIGAALPGIASGLESSLSPLISALNSAFGANTAAVRENTRALREAQFESTTIVQYGSTGSSGALRRRLGVV